MRTRRKALFFMNCLLTDANNCRAYRIVEAYFTARRQPIVKVENITLALNYTICYATQRIVFSEDEVHFGLAIQLNWCCILNDHSPSIGMNIYATANKPSNKVVK